MKTPIPTASLLDHGNTETASAYPCRTDCTRLKLHVEGPNRGLRLVYLEWRNLHGVPSSIHRFPEPGCCLVHATCMRFNMVVVQCTSARVPSGFKKILVFALSFRFQSSSPTAAYLSSHRPRTLHCVDCHAGQRHAVQADAAPRGRAHLPTFHRPGSRFVALGLFTLSHSLEPLRFFHKELLFVRLLEPTLPESFIAPSMLAVPCRPRTRPSRGTSHVRFGR